jgi:hypothetical protein
MSKSSPGGWDPSLVGFWIPGAWHMVRSQWMLAKWVICQINQCWHQKLIEFSLLILDRVPYECKLYFLWWLLSINSSFIHSFEIWPQDLNYRVCVKASYIQLKAHMLKCETHWPLLFLIYCKSVMGLGNYMLWAELFTSKFHSGKCEILPVPWNVTVFKE